VNRRVTGFLMIAASSGSLFISVLEEVF